MAVAEKQSFGSVVRIEHPVRGESLWMDSWRRLRRNKAALLGAFIILINILVAIFADSLAPKPFDRQVLADNNAAPLWVTQVFPTMIPRSEEHTSELQSRENLACRLLLEKKKTR